MLTWFSREKSMNNKKEAGFFEKLARSMPWLLSYPLWRAGDFLSRSIDATGPVDLILIIANHFEPAWDGTRDGLNLSDQMSRLDAWYRQAHVTASMIHDCDGAPFRHTNFYPAEQYHRPLLELLAQMQAEGLGE